MIKLYDARLTDLLTNGARYNPEVQAIAYAVLQEKRRIIDYAHHTRTLALIDELPEEILDVLAVELRTPAYDEHFTIETKRSLIKGTLPYYSKLGTPAAVNWVIETLFGNGQIQEWFTYEDREGEPHHFRVTVRNDGTFRTLDGLAEFIRLIEAVKRRSSWLDEIIVVTDLGPATLTMGGTLCTTVRVPLPELPDNFSFADTITTGGALAATHTVPLPELPDEFQFNQALRTGGALAAQAIYPIPVMPDSFQFSEELRAGGSMAAQAIYPVPALPDSFQFSEELRAGGSMAAQAVHPVPELPDDLTFESAIQSGGRMATNSRLYIPENTEQKPMTHTGRVGAQGAVNIVVPLPEIQ